MRLRIRRNSNNVLCSLKELPSQVGDIIIPPSVNEKALTCSQLLVVMDVAEGVSDLDKAALSEIKAGDVILVEKTAGGIVEFEEQKYVIVDIGQIFGIVKDMDRTKEKNK